ncbi:hypothetical protein SAMN04489729_3292 [Amycolatopsis lurida]|uniref:Uncharacterized protein n=1 Tax=Amycolatopsis lurida NRRL 2430 TaxID=1460371 RepID=A0A2P2FJQ3_AMYLU|nr:hypothetical protein [Amycolatopsis lurida]KFU76932.1 hypothetical protein BB31_33910 [Amycolatopsis lurida NRRL 2430]SED07633.1 hypothetical protein SAMN04489729_3292 [Amycolatopsis lurida]
MISGLDLGGHRGSVDAYVRAHGAVPHNSWVNRANGEATVVYDFAGNRLGLVWADGSIARIFVTGA